MQDNRKKIQRSARLIYILTKYGFDELVIKSGISKLIPESWQSKEEGMNKVAKGKTIYERIRMAMEELGPTYVKLGQVLSTIDLFPEELIQEFRKLQDRVEAENINIISKLEEELGEDPKEFFEVINPNPIAAASISQVYFAILKNGEKVVLKVKRSNIHKVIESDLLLMKDLSVILENNYDWAKRINLVYIIDTYEKSILQELSFLKELENIEKFSKNFENNLYIHVPRTYKEYSNNNILCMEYIEGIKISDKEELIKQGFDLKELAIRGIDLYLKQIIEYGFFHADPHSGNIFVLQNRKIVYIDFGTMGMLMPSDQEQIENMLIHVIKKDVPKIITSIKSIAIKYSIPDEKQLERDIYELLNFIDQNSLKDIDLKALIEKLLNILNKNEILMPSHIYLLGKGVLLMEGIGRNLSLDFNIIESIEPYVLKIIRKRLNPNYLLSKGIHSLQEISSDILSIPNELKIFIKNANEGKFKILYDFENNNSFIKTIHCLTLSLIVLSLLVSSAILSLSPLPPFLLGIPALSFFLMSFGLIILLYLLYTIKKGK
ncbi:AarF/ABC1/UbiB kinase family protein [Apibacter muscae]|uniref:ABC1 kinase family protein n=1 Tax=Apibacter muscae TaxID=2509004 RepID=UPI0011AC4F8D|nr:lipopolysaccharide core heptose(II) kinase RfaY [Apibacter muscae]TWP24400.1 AarF/ABC1/UbiB kinase family protein [Apibacter muscae]